MGGQETRSGKSPQPSQETFGLVETDRLIEAIRKSTFLLEPQKVSLERLIRSIPENLEPLPANVVGSVIIQRAEERDAAVSQNEYLWRENTKLRGENQTLKQQVRNLKRELSKREKEEERREELGDVFDGSITEKRIFERMLTVHERFVKNLQIVLEDISCKNADFDGLALLYLVFERLVGIDIGQLSPLEQREIGWLAKDLGFNEDHEVDLSPIEGLLTDLERELKEALEAPLEDSWPPLPVESKQTEEDTT